MKRINIIFLLLVFSNIVFSQARLVLNNDGYVVIKNEARLVIDNPNANAITTTGTGGNIVSENEYNIVKWNISTATGIYTIPWTTSPSGTNTKIPLSVNITSAGTGAGTILFSTYGGDWDNDTYKPSDVTNMSGLSGPNNSAYVIDRFYIIDAINYTTKPGVTISFGYDDAEHNATGNAITESGLQAQHFKSSDNTWITPPTGTVNTGSNTVSSIVVAPTDLNRSWTLVSNDSPLPIEIITFTAKCNNNIAEINWSTASEINNDYFTLEKSEKGNNFKATTTVNGAGNSNIVLNYSFIDENPYKGISYYRLKQTDYDGNFDYSDIKAVHCSFTNTDVNINVEFYPNPFTNEITIVINNLLSSTAEIEIYDVLGNKVLEQTLYNIDNNNNKFIISLSELFKGAYFIKFTSDDFDKTQKIIKN